MGWAPLVRAQSTRLTVRCPFAAGFMMGSLIAIIARKEGSYAYGRGEPAWQNIAGFAALALASAQMGMQGIVAKRLNTHFGTTVVLTTIWVELIADPGLLRFKKYARLSI